MDTPERAWTDSRLDDLRDKVGDGFAKVDARFERVDERFDKVDARFEKVNERFDKVDARFEKADARMDAGFARLDEKFDKKFDRLMWGLVIVGSGVVPALLGFIGSLIQSQIS